MEPDAADQLPVMPNDTPVVVAVPPQDQQAAARNRSRLLLPFIALAALTLSVTLLAYSPIELRSIDFQSTQCKIHSADPIRAGMVPAPVQAAFGGEGMVGMSERYEFEFPDKRREGVLLDTMNAVVDGRKAQAKLEKLISLKNHTIMVSTIDDLSKTYQKVEACFSTAFPTAEDNEGFIVKLDMTKWCKMRLLQHGGYHGWMLQENVAAQLRLMSNWAAARAREIIPVRKHMQDAKKHMDKSYAGIAKGYRLISGAEAFIASHQPRLTDLPDSPNARSVAALEKLQKEYIMVLWMDFKLSILDQVLADRADLLQNITVKVGKFQSEEVYRLERSPEARNQMTNVARGRLDAMPFRAAAMLKDVMGLLSNDEHGSYRKAACTWVKAKMPLDKPCTCQPMPKVSKTQKWFLTTRQRELAARNLVRLAFWQTMYDATPVTEYGEDAWKAASTTLVEKPDIRLHPACIASKR